MDTYKLAIFFHVASVVALVATHSVSMAVLFRLRRERDRTKILDLIGLSGTTVVPMYISLGLVLVSGSLAAFRFTAWGRWWLWLSLAILALTIGAMIAMAKPYFERVKEACAVRPSGVPRVADEELAEILRAPASTAITAIGLAGFFLVLALMVFKPGV